MTNTRLIFRALQDDLMHVAAVADALRASGTEFPTRTAAIRFALAFAAGHVASPIANANSEPA